MTNLVLQWRPSTAKKPNQPTNQPTKQKNPTLQIYWVLDGLKFNIQKTKIMASGPITSWQIDRETMETVTDFIFLGSKITTDGDWAMKVKDACSLEEKY